MRQKRHPIAAPVLKHLHDHVGQQVWLEELTDVAPGASLTGVRSLMLKLVKSGHAETVVRGNSWRFLGNPKAAAAPCSNSSSAALLTVVGPLKNGSLVLQHEDGTIYVAKVLDA